MYFGQILDIAQAGKNALELTLAGSYFLATSTTRTAMEGSYIAELDIMNTSSTADTLTLKSDDDWWYSESSRGEFQSVSEARG